MSELISGKEALIALANGEDVQYISAGMSDIGFWSDSEKTKNFTIHDFYSGSWAFRLKPRTITLNGIEVPACGTDYKPHTFMFVLNSLEPCEYSKIILDESDEIPPYWWKSEDEIKQVVAALKKIFVINNQ